MKCKRCKLIFQNPQEDIEKTISRYDNKYFQYELENQDNFFNLVKKTLEDFDIIKLLRDNAKILEIGSATGLFLKHMSSKGFDSIGVELCKESVEYGRKKYGVNLLHGRLEDMNFDDESFNFIHFSHLLEHLNNPAEFMHMVCRILKKEGLILLTTPNSSGLFANYYGELWRCIVDDHLFIYNKNNLKRLLSKYNLKILKRKTWGSIPEGKINHNIKRLIDWFAKKTETGDVVCCLAQKL